MGPVISAARVTSEELAGGLLNLVNWPMMMLSGVWFSLEGAGLRCRTVANIFPLTHILDCGARGHARRCEVLSTLRPSLLTLIHHERRIPRDSVRHFLPLESGLMTVTYELVDIGANLAHDSFDDDRDDVLRTRHAMRASRGMIITGSPATTATSDALATGRKQQTPAFIRRLACTRIMPVRLHRVERRNVDPAADRRKDDRCVAVGECGLDYFRNFSPREAQLDAFRAQLSIARGSQGLPGLPAPARCARRLRRGSRTRAAKTLSRAVAHCFTGEHESLREYVANGSVYRHYGLDLR